MPASYFVDSNVIIYFLDDHDPLKQAIATDLVRRAIELGEGCVSSQVVSGVLNVVTKVGAARLTTDEAALLLADVLEPLHLVRPTIEHFERALRVRERYGISFYDSLVIAAASLSECAVLYTEDLQHGPVYDGLQVVNPFAGPTP